MSPLFGKQDAQVPAPMAPPAAPPAPPAPATPQSADSTGEEALFDADTGILQFDFTGVQTEFEPLPVGLYSAAVEEVTFIPHSKKSGEPSVKFVFIVTDTEYEGRKLFYNTSLQKQAAWKFVKTLNALGVEVPSGPARMNFGELVGLPCVLSLTTGEYDGKPKNEIVEVLPAGADLETGNFPRI